MESDSDKEEHSSSSSSSEDEFAVEQETTNERLANAKENSVDELAPAPSAPYALPFEFN